MSKQVVPAEELDEAESVPCPFCGGNGIVNYDSKSGINRCSSEVVDTQAEQDVEGALVRLREMAAMDRIEVLLHLDSGFKIVGMRDANRVIDTGWHRLFAEAIREFKEQSK